MQTEEWLRLSAEHLAATHPLEWVAVLFAVASVLLARINSVWLYPAGIISTALYVWLFFRPEIELFAEGLLNVYYFTMSAYGWVHWIRRKNEPPLPVSRNSRQEWQITAAIVVIAWVLLSTLLRKFTSSDVPFWDAWVSATACAGMWLLARRKLENWILLNISNLSAIPLQIHKKMPLTAMLTLFLFIVAIFGFIEWRKIYRLQRASAKW